MAIWKQPTAYILCGLLCIGTFLRFDQISRESLWVDEYWALYLATGRGNTIFDIPLNTLVRNPPAANFKAAPHWWHIWTGLSSTPHPPLYHLMLRGWVDVFGDSDAATRAMSAVFGLASILLMFDLTRALLGKLAGIFAAGMMTFAPLQIDFSQQDRPYTLLMLLALALWRALILVEQKGCSRLRVLAICLAVVGMGLTHYFSVGVIAAAAVYAILRLRGNAQKTVPAAIATSLAFVIIIWGPFAWKTRHQYIAPLDFGQMGVSLRRAVIDVPRKILLGERVAPGGSAVLAWALAILAYASPAFRIRRQPQILPGWFWLLGGVGIILAVDLAGRTQFVDLPRYIFMCSPAIYLILAAPWGKGAGKFLPPVILLGTIIFGLSRWQAGPSFSESTSALAPLIHQKVGADDAVIITGQFSTEPAFRYFIVSHYAGDWRCPVVLADKPLNSQMDRELGSFQYVWVIGRDSSEMEKFFPGWRIDEFHGIGPGYSFWRIQRAK
jgi:uncharacterized membrane protein